MAKNTKYASLTRDEIEGLRLHPLCEAFPPMSEPEYESLVESMKSNGYLETDPIIIIDPDPDSDGMVDPVYQVLDGRNRLEAAQDAGVVPIFVEYIGKDPVSFVVSRNTDRRHLSTGQKAAVASGIANMEFGQNQFSKDYSTTRDEAAAMLQTTTKAIQRFRFVQNIDTELAELIAEGSMTLNEAFTEAKKKQDLQPNGTPVTALESEPGTSALEPHCTSKGDTPSSAPDVSEPHTTIPGGYSPLEEIVKRAVLKYEEITKDAYSISDVENIFHEIAAEGYVLGTDEAKRS